MARVLTDEELNELDERANEVISSLSTIIPSYNEEIAISKYPLKERKIKTGMLYQRMDIMFRRNGVSEYAIEDSTYIGESYKRLQKITEFLLDEGYPLVMDKTLICSYIGITTAQFNQFAESEDKDMRKVICWISDSLSGTAFIASETGVTNATATHNRLKTKGQGQGLKQAEQEINITDDRFADGKELARRLELMGIGNKKFLKGKKLKNE